MIDKNSFVHDNATISKPVVISSGAEVHGNTSIGKYTAIGRNSIIYTNTCLGAFCSIGRFVEIGLARHPTNWLSTHVFQFNKSSFKDDPDLSNIARRHRGEKMHQNTIIGNDVWIGAKASIASGINVGDGAIVLAHAMVAENVPPYCIYGGVPAKKIGQRFSDDIINSLVKLKWWELPMKSLSNIIFEDIDLAVEQLNDIKEIQSRFGADVK